MSQTLGFVGVGRMGGPMAGRLARSLEFPSRRAFLEEYRERTRWVRALYDRVVPP